MGFYSKIGTTLIVIAEIMPLDCDIIMPGMKPADEQHDYISTADGTWVAAPVPRGDLMLAGVDFTNPVDNEIYTLSATKFDMFGLGSVKDEIALGLVTNFHFDNGTIIELSSVNFEAMRAVWVPFRASFF